MLLGSLGPTTPVCVPFPFGCLEMVRATKRVFSVFGVD